MYICIAYDGWFRVMGYVVTHLFIYYVRVKQNRLYLFIYAVIIDEQRNIIMYKHLGNRGVKWKMCNY